MSFNLKAFKQDLKVLLKEHDAELGVDIDGDTHGLRVKFVVYNRTKNREHVLNHGEAYLLASDIK